MFECSKHRGWTDQKARKGKKREQIEPQEQLATTVVLLTWAQLSCSYIVRETGCNIQIVAAESVDDDGIEFALSRRTRSSLIFLAVKSPVGH